MPGVSLSKTMGFEIVLMHYVGKFDTEKPHSGSARTSVTKIRPIQLNLNNTILYITVQYNCALLSLLQWYTCTLVQNRFLDIISIFSHQRYQSISEALEKAPPMASAMTSPTAKLTVMKNCFNTESAHTAINNVISRKKLSEGEKSSVRTTMNDFFFIVRNDGKKEEFTNEKREAIWQALEFLKTAANIKFLHADIQRAMEGFRPGVLSIAEDDDAGDDLGLDSDSVTGGDDDQASGDGDVGSDDEGPGLAQESPFKSILQPETGGSGSYLNCEDRGEEAGVHATAQKRKNETSSSKPPSSNKKARAGASLAAVGTFKVRIHTSKYADLCISFLSFLSGFFCPPLSVSHRDRNIR